MRSPVEGSAGQLVAYALPVLALSTPFFWLHFFGLPFATDVLTLPPATAGAILGIARLWDAVTDPVVGVWSDRTRTRLGRRRPWMLAAAPLLAGVVALQWRPPGSSPATTTVWWLGFALLFTTAFTAWVIPHQALGVEIARTPRARTRLFGARQAALMGGVFVSFACMQAVVSSEVPREAAARIALLLALAAAVLLPLPALLLREPARAPAPASRLGALRDVLRNPDGRRVLGVWGVDQLGLAVQGIVAPYFAIHLMRRADLVGVVPVFFLLPSVLSIPVWVALAGRLGRRRTWRLSMVASSVAFLPLAVVGADDVVRVAVVLATAGAASGCTGAIGPAVLADVIDDDAARTRERKEGSYSAAWLLVLKLAGATVALLTGLALQVSGFSAEAPVQPPAARLALRGLMGVLPAAALACGAWWLRGLRLGEVRDARPAPVRA